MAKNDSDLFDRLKRAGLRKQVAKTLSEIEGAGKKAQRAARRAVGDLRSIADELERRLPVGDSAPARKPAPARRRARTSARAAKPAAATTAKPAARSRTAGGRAAGASAPARRTTARRATARKPAASATRAAAASAADGARAPRGQNKAKILAALKTGPKTAAEVAKETGIGTGVVGSTLTKMAASGEVAKATRGYALPK